jgi:hypothetical protein
VGLNDPKIAVSEKFSDHYSEGERFYLTGIRTVEVTTDYGEGSMILLTVQGVEPELGVWGDYLVKQAEACEPADLNKWYVLTRRVVDGFSKRPVKALSPAQAPGQEYDPATLDGTPPSE